MAVPVRPLVAVVVPCLRPVVVEREPVGAVVLAVAVVGWSVCAPVPGGLMRAAVYVDCVVCTVEWPEPPVRWSVSFSPVPARNRSDQGSLQGGNLLRPLQGEPHQ